MNAEEICQAAKEKKMTFKEAVAALVALGYELELARENVFIAMGGDDVVGAPEEK